MKKRCKICGVEDGVYIREKEREEVKVRIITLSQDNLCTICNSYREKLSLKDIREEDKVRFQILSHRFPFHLVEQRCCLHCISPFITGKLEQKFCSSRCRSRYHNSTIKLTKVGKDMK